MSVIPDRLGFGRSARTIAPPEPAPPATYPVIVIGVALALTLEYVVWVVAGGTLASLAAIGLALGFVLFHSRFGFTSAWRQLVSVGQGAALRAHMLMLAVAVTLFAPILAAGTGLNGPVAGSVQPIGISLFVGSFLFGLGMQLGGSCASGTLFSIGSGQTAIVLTLGGFIVGSLIGAYNVVFWTTEVWTGPAVSLADTRFGYFGAWVMSLAAMGVIVGVTVGVARRKRPPAAGRAPVAKGLARALRGSWPLWVGAMLLAGLNALTLWVSGGPWGVTSAFALWGAKLLGVVGIDVSGWAYWQQPPNAAALQASVFADKISVMNFGIMIGALIASSLAGAFILHRRIPPKLALGAVLGGILMGYGARLAYGCNIGAYFSGIASFSLHGWIWAVFAIGGTFAGVALRPMFGLTNPKPSDAVC